MVRAGAVGRLVISVDSGPGLGRDRKRLSLQASMRSTRQDARGIRDAGLYLADMKRITSLLFLLMGAALPVHAGFPDSPLADLVLGAPDLDTPGSAAANDTSFDYPIGVAVDPVSGKLFVSCYDQHRVLRFASTSALATGAAAEAVFGQPGLTSAGSGTTRASLNTPLGICLDSQGRLWVAEVANHRVLMFEDAANAASGVEASLVIGQPDFDSKASGTGLGQFTHPAAVFVDAGDNLWVCDYLNSRVLKFPAASSLTNGAAATVEIGGNGTSANQLFYPIGVLVDAGDRLWVVEQNNNRVLKFGNAGHFASGAAASVVLGQPGFGSDSQGTSATTMRVPSGLAMDTEGHPLGGGPVEQPGSRLPQRRRQTKRRSGRPGHRPARLRYGHAVLLGRQDELPRRIGLRCGRSALGR